VTLDPPPREEDAAALAFEALREEVVRLRDDLASAGGVDYAPTLGAIARSLADIEAHPALQLTPQVIAGQLRRAADLSAQNARRETSLVLQRLDAAAMALEHLLAGRRSVRSQQRWLVTALACGVLAGAGAWVWISWPVARLLPGTWHVPDKMAAATLDLDRWQGGISLMAGADPSAWRDISEATRLVRANRDALEVCRKSAKPGRSHRCVVMLPAR
jgi:hypothetical protein